MEILKIPVQLCKRMGDGPTGEIRYQIEVPEQYLKKSIYLDLYRQHYFIIIGPFETETEIEKAIINKEIEHGEQVEGNDK